MTYEEERNDQNYEFYDFNEINVIWIVFSVKNIHVYPFKNVFVFAVKITSRTRLFQAFIKPKRNSTRTIIKFYANPITQELKTMCETALCDTITQDNVLGPSLPFLNINFVS